MSNIPLNDFPINPNVTSGVNLADILNRFELAMLSAQSGTSAPPVFQVGSFWLDNTDSNAYKLMIYTSTGWSEFLRFNPTTGVIVAGGVTIPVKTVNTRIGDVLVKEIYDSNATPAIIAQGTTTGLNMVVNNAADPALTLTGTIGRLAFNTTTNEFVGRDNTAWNPLGGGKYSVYPTQTVSAAAAIAEVSSITAVVANVLDGTYLSLYDTLGQQIVFFFDLDGSGIAAPSVGFRQTRISFLSTDSNNAFAIKISNVINSDPAFSATSGINVVSVTCLIAGSTDDISAGNSGLVVNTLTQGISSGTEITTNTLKGFQFRPITSGAPITLATAPFGALPWPGGTVVTVENAGSTNITINDGTSTANGVVTSSPIIMFPNTVHSFIFDAVRTRWLPYGGGGGSAVPLLSTHAATAGSQITLTNVPNQRVNLTAVAAVTLAAAAFIIPSGFQTGSRVELWGPPTNSVGINYNAASVITFGDYILQNYYNMIFEYDGTRMVQVSKNF